MFNPMTCPLFQWRLSLFDRIMYCSGVWCYMVGAISTPMYIAIPLITVRHGHASVPCAVCVRVCACTMRSR